MTYRVLICDDDPDIVNALEIYLAQDGYTIVKAENGKQAVAIMEKQEIHLVLMDIMMPEMDGITAAVKIRENSNVPIVFLSAKSEDTDRILGLDMGGDDYITKPFNPVELRARVKANLRRYSRLGGITPVAEKSNVYTTGGMVLDDEKKLVSVEGEDVALTATEYKILLVLISHMGQVFSANQIYEQAWGEPAFDVGKTVSVHIRHIREKIEINPKEPRYLKIVYGLGYKVVKVK